MAVGLGKTVGEGVSLGMGEAVGGRVVTVGAMGIAAPGVQAVKSRIKNVKEKTFGLRILIFLVFVRDGKKIDVIRFLAFQATRC